MRVDLTPKLGACLLKHLKHIASLVLRDRALSKAVPLPDKRLATLALLLLLWLLYCLKEVLLVIGVRVSTVYKGTQDRLIDHHGHLAYARDHSLGTKLLGKLHKLASTHI